MRRFVWVISPVLMVTAGTVVDPAAADTEMPRIAVHGAGGASR